MPKRKYLETIFSNFGSYESPNGVFNQADLNNSPLIRARISLRTGQVHGIKREAINALYGLTHAIYTGTDRYRRGSTFKEISDAVFDTLMEFFDQAPAKVDADTIATIDRKIEAWFCAKATSTYLYIPCDINPYPAKSFTIGAIRFTFLTEFIPITEKSVPNSFVFEQMYEAMRQHGTLWMAEIEVHDCLPNRAAEIGDLAVDLALVALQLIVPLKYSERIARLHARRVPQLKNSVSISNGHVSADGTNQQPGHGFDGSVLEKIISQESHVLASVGKRINAFLNGHGSLPRLNQSWNDAAYWFHEGIAEPLDTIAVPKLETAIEVLLCAVSSKGSEVRIIQAIKTFYGLESDQTLSPDSIITVKEFAKGLVRDRSRLLHGTWSTLTTDMRSSRSSLTVLAHELLIQFSMELDEYEAAGTMIDDIDPFLTWIEARR
ncbi:MAG: hypothetical protein Q7T66_16000 [Herminiimonas sp.]|uniref:hypothetical protein n=1 Tax=Herminiimonas sp. TaxID=1926289 RepID=UPI002724A5E5|nr:hypothetical protein [Herminiimonas sp.]MDO9422164.1 hypothetical protein [Herminiimonas sp.]